MNAAQQVTLKDDLVEAGVLELWESMYARAKMTAPTMSASRIAMTRSWPIVTRTERFGVSATASTLGGAPRISPRALANAVRSKVPRGSEVGEIPTLSRNCKWSCFKTM